MTLHTDKNLGTWSLTETVDPAENDQEKSLQWLLERDLSEPEETLFTVAGNDYLDTGLSPFEAEFAGRPLVRGNAGSDDLASYVEEEIVISSAEAGSDIYHRKEDPVVVESPRPARDEVMAIDFSRRRDEAPNNSSDAIAEGVDILGLAGDDDIGEKFVAIKRVKPLSENDAAPVDVHSGRSSVERSELKLATPQPCAPQEELSPAAASPEIVSAVSDAAAVLEQGLPEVGSYSSVRDFVATLPQSADDEEFDSFLLAGGHLPDGSSDPEDLVVQPTEGVLAVDTSTDSTIDYHEDFRGMAGFDDNSASAVAAVITPVMEAMSSAVRARLQELGCDPGAVSVDVRVGADTQAAGLCAEQGYRPVHSFAVPLPLLTVEQTVRDAIYVRFWNVQHDANWNALFDSDFAVPAQSGNSAGDMSLALVSDGAQPGGFGEDIFGTDFADDFPASVPGDDSVVADDIEAAFANLAQFQESADEICGLGFEVFETHAADQSVVEPFDAPAQAGVADAAGIEQEHGAPATQHTAVEPPFSVQDNAVTLDNAAESDLAAFDGTCLDGFVPDYIAFSYSTQSNAEIFTDFLDAFIEEGSAEVEKLEHEVGEWEKSVASEPLFAKVSRTLHTIKGIAKGVGLHRLGTLVHNFETLLEKMPRPNGSEEQAYFRIVNAWLDAVVRGVEHVVVERADVASEFPVPITDSARQQPVEAVELPQAQDVAPRPVATTIISEEIKSTVISALEKKRDQQLADEGAKALAAQQSVRITSEKLDHLLNLTSQAQQLGVRASQNTTRSKRSSAELQARLSSVRTHIRKIADRALLDVNARPGSSTPDMDALEMDQYSELQEAANILREGVEDLADLVDVVSRQNMQIETLLKQQSSVISSISSSIQGARVVPVSRLMPGLRRIVRTVSTDLGKIVSFKALNETGALDRDHYARLQVVLEHMVRNALDHGIETPEERMAMGKPTGGRITIDVRKSGGDYLVRLADDGRGIDPDAIRESAYEKGLDVDVDALSDEEAIRLIFHKGFSTASAVSEISGRGVGMDIVLTELQQIGGDVQIQSAVGLGTAFEVRIPSNVSVNGALLVRAAGESYAIPLNGLVAVEQVPAEEFFTAVAEQSTLTVADVQCDPTYLATLCQGLGLPDRSVWGSYVPVIIAGTTDRYMAIAIDSLEEALELVVRSLGSQFSTVPGVAGAATTAEGEAIIALDLNLLVSVAGAGGIAPVAVNQSKVETLLALVVDDSRTQRMVATSQLDTVGVETVTAENGLVAIDLLNATHRLPDIILLDVEMPVKDGIQTLREIRKSRRYGHLPVIMVTSRTGAKHRALASEAGCNAYMGKPFNFPELIRQINALTGHELQLS